MSTPVIEKIALYLLTVIDSITVANGYNYDLHAIRPKVLVLDQDLLKDKNVILTQGTAGEPELVKGSGDPGDEWIHQWQQPFGLHALVFSLASDTVGIETKLNQIRSDIEKAIGVADLVQDADEKRANGQADSIELKLSQRDEYEQGFTGMVTGVIVGYCVKANDPYTVR
jgi:hypothetical protein